MTSYVYFIKPVGQDGPIKIGCSRWLPERFDALQTWSPVPLEIIACSQGDFALERALHREFAHLRMHKEWFQPDASLLARISRVASGESIADAFGFEPIPAPVHSGPRYRIKRSTVAA